MELQRILFPRIGTCTENELYFRLDSTGKKSCGKIRTQYLYGDQQIEFDRHGKARFDTYFNGLSIEKWFKYTIVTNVSLKLAIAGKFKVTLLGRMKIRKKISEKVLAEQVLESDIPREFVIPYTGGSDQGMFTFALEALESGSRFYGGAYVTDIDAYDIRNVKLGIGICTFRREAFIEKNLKILNEAIFQNVDSPLYGHAEVFIADNGKSLDIESLQSESMHIFPNKNLVQRFLIPHILSTRYVRHCKGLEQSLCCRQSTMPPHRFLPPPCTGTNIEHLVYKG